MLPHREYLSLGASAAERQGAYRALFDAPLRDERIAEVRATTQQQKALGSSRFQAEIELALGRCAVVRPGHRPPRNGL